MQYECIHENKELVVKASSGEPDKLDGMVIWEVWFCKDCKKTFRKVYDGTFSTKQYPVCHT